MSYRYVVLGAESRLEIEGLVEEHVEDGYRCVGGICVIYFPPSRPMHRLVYYQAMERYETIKIEPREEVGKWLEPHPSCCRSG